jgi:hypothetical protein
MVLERGMKYTSGQGTLPEIFKYSFVQRNRNVYCKINLEVSLFVCHGKQRNQPLKFHVGGHGNFNKK